MLKLVSASWAASKLLFEEVRLLPLRAAVALGASGLGQPPRPDQLWKALGIVLPIGLATWWAIPQVTLVASPSIDAWALRSAPGPIQRGDLVSFLLSHPLAGPRPVDVTKYVLCLPGDRITMVETPSALRKGLLDGRYFCNGRAIGVSKAVGRAGQLLTHWKPQAPTIPDGFAYVGSAHASGFDSRYYGLIAISRLRRMEKVL